MSSPAQMPVRDDSYERLHSIEEHHPTRHRGMRTVSARMCTRCSAARLVLGLMVAAMALRMHQLTASGFSLDEGIGTALSQRPLDEMIGLLRFEANGIVYQALLWPLLQLSEAEVVVRGPAVVIGVLCVGATYWTGMHLLNRQTGLVAAALMAVHPFAIDLSQAGRYYTVTVLFSVLSVGTLAVALRRGDGRSWAFYAATTALAVYSNALALLLLPVVHLAVGLPQRQRWRVFARSWAIAAAGVGLLAIPQIVLLVMESGLRDPLYHLRRPDIPAAAAVAGKFVTGSSTASPRAVVLAALVGLAAAVVIIRAFRRSSAGVRLGAVLDDPTVALVVWAVVPGALLYVVSQRHPIFGDRYLIASLPAIPLLIAALLTRLPARVMGVGVVLVLVLLLVPALDRAPQVSDYRSAAAWIEGRRGADDPLVVVPMERLPALAYYARTLRVEGGLIPVEEWRDTALPAGVTGFRLPGGYGRTAIGPPAPEDVRQALTRTGRVFFVLYGNELGAETAAWTRRHCRAVVRHFRLLDVIEISFCRATPAAA